MEEDSAPLATDEDDDDQGCAGLQPEVSEESSDDGDRDEGGNDQNDVDREPYYVSMMLPSVERQIRQQERDRRQVRQRDAGERTCCFCEIADSTVPGVAEQIRELFDLDQSYRGVWDDSHLDDALCKKANVIHKRLTTSRAGTKTRLGRKQVDIEDIRLHFRGDHIRQPQRRLQKRLDYLLTTLETLEQGGMWKQNAIDSTDVQPNHANHQLYFRTLSHAQRLAQEISRMNGNTGTASSRTGLTGGVRKPAPPPFSAGGNLRL